MRTHEIEAWALKAIERAELSQPNEDSQVELKTDWPDHARAARRIAGHANAARGDPILWVIGVDEHQGVKGAIRNDLSTWWPQVSSHFDGPVPVLRDVLVHWKGKTAVALYFETNQIPYLVKNPAFNKPNGGPVQLEVPWRDGTAVRSAGHSDLVLLLSPLQRPVLKVEVRRDRGFVNHYPLDQPSGPATAAYYLRVKVVNIGRRTAEKCCGYLANVEVWRHGDFQATLYADFMPLVWSHNIGRRSSELLPLVPHWLDVVSTLEDDRRFFLQTDPQTPKYKNAFQEPGVYKLTIQVFAEDAEPRQVFVFLKWDCRWDYLDVFDEAEWEKRKAAE
jgi:hypothetical protein